MIRAAALTVVLTLAGTPAATAACLVWCGSPCPQAGPQDRATISTGHDTCEELLVAAPSLREDTRRERQGHSAAHLPFLAARTVSVELERRVVSWVVFREHAPPAHQTPPTVLRL